MTFTPDMEKQIKDCVIRIKNMRAGGAEDLFIRAGLAREGWEAAAIKEAFERVDE